MERPGRSQHTVGLRELRHDTSGVFARVRDGETIDVTDYGRLVARIVPVEDRALSSAMQRMFDAGRIVPAVRPGFRARMLAGDGTDRLADTLTALRDQER